MKKIYLASASPRRSKILSDAGFEFSVCPADINENISSPGASMLVRELSLLKAAEAAKSLRGTGYVIGADTVVAIGDKVLGKPLNKRHARLMLKLLSGRSHSVLTGVCVLDLKTGAAIAKCEESEVYFKKLTNRDIREYVDTNEPMDKAGSYAIQEKGGAFVESFSGNFDNIIGFPMKTFNEILQEFENEKGETD